VEIARPFIRLPYAFDAEILARETQRLPATAWMPHPLGLEGNHAVPLISRGGGDNDDFNGRMASTRHLAACPYVQQTMAALGEVLGRSRLMKLAPGCQVSEHIDFNYHWYTRVRIHIPVVTNPQVTFFCGDEQVHMRPGECWIFNSWQRHRVVNSGRDERTHLVVDAAGSSRFWRTVRRMQRFDPVADAAVLDAMVERFDFVPGRKVCIRTEQVNVTPVMSPGELDALVTELVRDFSQNLENGQETVRHYTDLLWDFAKDWREIWHQYGYGPAGWPHYQASIATAHGRLNPDSRAPVTHSNGIGVNRVIIHRILKPALAIDQYQPFLEAAYGNGSADAQDGLKSQLGS
jgi:hypothetical protein